MFDGLVIDHFFPLAPLAGEAFLPLAGDAEAFLPLAGDTEAFLPFAGDDAAFFPPLAGDFDGFLTFLAPALAAGELDGFLAPLAGDLDGTLAFPFQAAPLAAPVALDFLFSAALVLLLVSLAF